MLQCICHHGNTTLCLPQFHTILYHIMMIAIIIIIIYMLYIYIFVLFFVFLYNSLDYELLILRHYFSYTTFPSIIIMDHICLLTLCLNFRFSVLVSEGSSWDLADATFM